MHLQIVSKSLLSALRMMVIWPVISNGLIVEPASQGTWLGVLPMPLDWGKSWQV